MPSIHQPPLGVLLAGGLARRMGGDKPMRQIGGRSILERAITRLIPQCDGLILNANGDPDHFSSFELPVVPDNLDGFLGPLAGLLAALDWAVDHRPDAEWVVSMPADAPFLPSDLVVKLQEVRADSGAMLAVASSGGKVHPVAGLWNVALRNDLRSALVAENIRRVNSWIAGHAFAIAQWPVEPLDPFFNVNTINDLAEAERLAVLQDNNV